MPGLIGFEIVFPPDWIWMMKVGIGMWRIAQLRVGKCVGFIVVVFMIVT
jgi:hypothetical protein